MRLTTLIPILPLVAFSACANTAKDQSNDPDSVQPAEPADVEGSPDPMNPEPAPMNELDPEPAPAEGMDPEPADPAELDPEPAPAEEMDPSPTPM